MSCSYVSSVVSVRQLVTILCEIHKKKNKVFKTGMSAFVFFLILCAVQVGSTKVTEFL